MRYFITKADSAILEVMLTRIEEDSLNVCLIHSTKLVNWFVVDDDGLAETLLNSNEVREMNIDEYLEFWKGGLTDYSIIGNEALVRTLIL